MASTWPHMEIFPIQRLFVSSRHTSFLLDSSWPHIQGGPQGHAKIHVTESLAWQFWPEAEDGPLDALGHVLMENWSTWEVFFSSQCASLLFGASPSELSCDLRSQDKKQDKNIVISGFYPSLSGFYPSWQLWGSTCVFINLPSCIWYLLCIGTFCFYMRSLTQWPHTPRTRERHKP
jgi:hypothetical protein